MSHAVRYFSQVIEVARQIDTAAVERLAQGLAKLRERGGRLFLLGVGGSAANCAHAVNDFRKLAGIEAYSPCDNVAELTARTNDEGWDTVFAAWLRGSNATSRDAVLVLSVGGGSAEHNVSPNIVRALEEARARQLTIYGIVGRDGGFTKQVADEVVLVPTVDPELVTPHAESFQAVIWHCLVCHPCLQRTRNTWEAIHARRPAA
ncbi:sugar isomerase [Planctomycetaceae bacterium SCGC AG-212-F19]|nr:sugar isomerase [Planctomycetaceae bacterium SCGC AG-212-F19]